MKQLLVLIGLFFILLSCSGSRKVKKEKLELRVLGSEKLKSNEVTVSDIVIDVTKKYNLNVDANEITITPVDATKPFTITDSSGKETVYKNAILNLKTTKSKENSTEEIKQTDKSIVDKDFRKEVKEDVLMTDNVKEVDKVVDWRLWYSLLPILLTSVCWWLWKRKKD